MFDWPAKPGGAEADGRAAAKAESPRPSERSANHAACAARHVPRPRGSAREWRGHSPLFDEDPFERREPMPIIALAGVGIARCLGAPDLRGERGRPLRPAEQPAPMERQRQREGLRLPGRVEYRTLPVPWYARELIGEFAGVGHAGSR